MPDRRVISVRKYKFLQKKDKQIVQDSTALGRMGMFFVCFSTVGER